MNTVKPVYLLSGDSYHHQKSRDPLIREMLGETGISRPSVAYIGTASGDDPGFFQVIKTLLERGVTGLIRERFLAGAVLAGFSAGSILLSRQWVHWRDPDDNSTAESVDNIGDISPAFFVHQSEYEYQI
ncbi:MAG: hypothetical protein WCI03_11750 [bacterium]